MLCDVSLHVSRRGCPAGCAHLFSHCLEQSPLIAEGVGVAQKLVRKGLVEQARHAATGFRGAFHHVVRHSATAELVQVGATGGVPERLAQLQPAAVIDPSAPRVRQRRQQTARARSRCSGSRARYFVRASPTPEGMDLGSKVAAPMSRGRGSWPRGTAARAATR